MLRPALPWLFSLLVASAASAQPAPIPPGESVSHIKVPPGFKVTLFAGEPDLVQPIAMTTDDRGRLWVVENLSYPEWKSRPEDRVSIYEDKDNDGHFDKKTVFWDKGQNLSGIALGYGGVWLCSTPNFVFVPDADGDDKPDGPPKILLDGWDIKAKHNVFNSLTWGPDGWLYGCNGITSNSLVGKPGTPEKARTPMNCGVWRFHPKRETFEVVFNGTTNPWGLDFDEHGQIFITNCVIEHAWQGIPGANLKRMFGQPFNPHLYELMSSPVDHIHWAGGPWQEARGGSRHDDFGGGHAHSGGLIYLGDNFPPEYRGSLFTGNIHGNRINRDTIEPKGSGSVLKHAPDFLRSDDPWFRPIALHMGPDGGIYVADWSDTGECHDYEDIHRENGRIYKVIYGEPNPLVLPGLKTRTVPGKPSEPFAFSRAADQARVGTPIDLAALTDRGLLEFQFGSSNPWFVRHARRLLAERRNNRVLELDNPFGLFEVTLGRRGPEHVIADLNINLTFATLAGTHDEMPVLLDQQNVWLRVWAIRLMADEFKPSPAVLDKFASLAKSDPSPVVRLALASALQRLPLSDRWEIAAGLASHAEDAADQNLPLMIWYGIEPLVPSDPDRALKLAAGVKIPLVRQYIARRYASLAK